MDNRELAIKWYRDQQMPCFQIMDPLLQYTYYKFCGNDVDNAVAALENALSLIPRGHYKILARPSPKAAKSDSVIFDLYIEDKKDDNKISTSPSVNISGYSKEYVDRILSLERKIIELEKQIEIERLKQKFLSKKEDDREARVLEKISEFFKVLMNQNQNHAVHMQQTPAISGANENKKARIKQALRVLMKIDKNFVEHLELLAVLAQQSPETYFYAVNMLKNQVNVSPGSNTSDSNS